MRKLRKYLRRLLISIAYMGLIVLLISSFSNRVSPLTNIYLPYLGLFFPIILAFNLLFFLLWLITGQWKQVGVTLLVFVICGGAISAYFPLHRRTKNVPEDCIKILTYNVMRFDYLKKHTSDSPNPIVQYVIDQDPDIVCFQEFAVSTSSKRQLTFSDLQTAFNRLPYCRIDTLQFPYSSQVFGLAIFSKFPILSLHSLPIKSNFNGSFIAELDIRGRKVCLINNHLESNKISADERTDYYNLTKDPDTQKLETFTHFMFQRLTPAFRIRAKQGELISSVIRENTHPYVIVCGDFNDTPLSYARYKIKGDLKDAFVESGSGMGITFNRHRFLFRIDYILHSKNIKAYNCTVGRLKNSDHYPVWTYLQFQE
ncbi:MAG: endonuclease/exonuclease/phosphatase family protein [Candidatus Azobacteroides sp.]|nr:endonuclease/exonuclease/phosphatase family protein [Candidatus Azobacteroides sp.]